MEKMKKYYREIIIAILAVVSIGLLLGVIIPPIIQAVNRGTTYGTYDVYKQTKKDNFDLQNEKLSDEIAESVANGEERLVFFGDSITEIAPLNDMYPYKSANPDRVFNRGISGDTAICMRDRLTNVTTLKPSILILLIGVNDVSYNASNEEINGYVSEIIDGLQKHATDNKYKMDIYVQSVLPAYESGSAPVRKYNLNEDSKKLNTLYAATCVEKNVQFIDTYDYFTDDKGNLKEEYTYDGLHPNAKGYYVMRDALEELIFSVRKQSSNLVIDAQIIN